MSLVARHLEANGIPTVTFSNARDISASACNPRLVFTNYPLGNPTGRPFDVDNQRAILTTAFRMLATAAGPGEIVDTPHQWDGGQEWMRLIFSDEQPFLSDEAETERQMLLDRNRQTKDRSTEGGSA